MASIPSPDKHPGILLQGTKGFGPGRSLLAARDYEPGDLIALFDEPLVAFPDAANVKTTCNHCLAQGPKVFGCTGCDKAVKYCSSECQKANWKLVHAKECKVFRRVKTAVGKDWLPTPVRALVQLLLRWSEVRGLVDGLEGNPDCFRARSELWENMKLQAYAGIHYAGRREDDANLNMAAEILCKIQTNSFDRFDADTGQSGTFLDPVLAMVNHSCIPNSVVVFWRRRAYLRAEAPVGKGEEITISYVDYTKPLAVRRENLELYHFECTCPRCRDDLDVYKVCQASPLLALNDRTVSPGLWRLRNPPTAVELSECDALCSQVATVYAACSHDRPPNPTVGERLERLRANWRSCKPLVDGKLWALEPVPQTIQSATMYYLAVNKLASALSTACFSSLYCDPYQYVAPFKPLRLTGLMLIAKILTQTSVPEREELARDAHSGIMAVMDRSDQASILQAILLLVIQLAPKGHSADWEILDEARLMLSGIEGIVGRENDSSMLQKWVKNPDSNPAGEVLFRERVLKPIEELAQIAVEVIESDMK